MTSVRGAAAIVGVADDASPTGQLELSRYGPEGPYFSKVTDLGTLDTGERVAMWCRVTARAERAPHSGRDTMSVTGWST